MYVIVVEDPHAARGVASAFKQEGLSVAYIEPRDFVEWINSLSQADISTIDAFLLGSIEQWLQFPKTIRQRCEAPILGVNDGKNFAQTVSLLGAGADDVINAAIHPLEIVARVSAINRRVRKGATTEIDIGELRIFLDGRLPEIAGKPVELTRREQRILEYLARNRRRYLSKAQIFNAVYGLFDDTTDDRVIESHICKLRKKLTAGLGIDPIQTRRYLGYALLEQPSLLTSDSLFRSKRQLEIDLADVHFA